MHERLNGGTRMWQSIVNLFVPRHKRVQRVIQSAERLLDEGKPREAYRRLIQILELWPDDGPTLVMAGLARVAMGDREGAVPLLFEGLQAVPGHLKARVALGEIWDGQGENEKSLELYEAGVWHHPEEPLLRYRWAEANERLAKGGARTTHLNEAKEGYRTAAELARNKQDENLLAAALNKQGMVHIWLAEVEAALSAFEATVKSAPRWALAHYNLSIAAERLHHQTKDATYLKRAVEAIEEAAALDPENEQILTRRKKLKPDAHT